MISPPLAEILRKALDSRLEQVYTCLPGEIVSYDPATSTATVQIVIRSPVTDTTEADYVDRYEDLAPVPDVPIMWPRANGVSITWPLSAGDGVMVFFSMRDPAMWRGGSGGAANPPSVRLHAPGYAFALPAVGVDGSAPGAASASGLCLAASSVLLGGSSATSGVLRAPAGSPEWCADVTAAILALDTQIKAVPAPGAGIGPSAAGRLTAGTYIPSISSKVKAE